MIRITSILKLTLHLLKKGRRFMKKALHSKQQSASWICLLIILFLELISFAYHTFNIDVILLFSIIQLIDDASIIITIICLILLVLFCIPPHRDYAGITICVTNIMIANKLYHNSRLIELYNWLLTRDIRIWLFIIICVICIVSFVFAAKKKNRKFQTTPLDDNTQHNNGIVQSAKSPDSKPDSDNFIKKKSSKSFPNDFPTNHNSLGRIVNIVYWAILGVFIVLLVWGITTHILFNTSAFILYPPFSTPQLTNVIYFSITISAAVIMAMIIVRISMYIHKTHTSKPNGSSGQDTFSVVSTFLALGVEVILVTIGLRGDSASTNSLFIDLFTDNILVSLLVLIILFFVIQIIITVVSGFFNKVTKSDTKSGKMILESKMEMEQTVIKLVCGMLAGALNLLLIIPDFLSCIHTVLCDNDDETKQYQCDNQKNDGSEKNE